MVAAVALVAVAPGILSVSAPGRGGGGIGGGVAVSVSRVRVRVWVRGAFSAHRNEQSDFKTVTSWDLQVHPVPEGARPDRHCRAQQWLGQSWGVPSVCTDCGLPPIPQCHSGHLGCSNCRPKFALSNLQGPLGIPLQLGYGERGRLSTSPLKTLL